MRVTKNETKISKEKQWIVEKKHELIELKGLVQSHK